MIWFCLVCDVYKPQISRSNCECSIEIHSLNIAQDTMYTTTRRIVVYECMFLFVFWFQYNRKYNAHCTLHDMYIYTHTQRTICPSIQTALLPHFICYWYSFCFLFSLFNLSFCFCFSCAFVRSFVGWVEKNLFNELILTNESKHLQLCVFTIRL